MCSSSNYFSYTYRLHRIRLNVVLELRRVLAHVRVVTSLHPVVDQVANDERYTEGCAEQAEFMFIIVV